MSHPRFTTVPPAFYDGATRVLRGCYPRKTRVHDRVSFICFCFIPLGILFPFFKNNGDPGD